MLILLCASCSQPLTLEQQIISSIRNMEAHVEANERRAFMQYLAEDFRGQGGEFNHDQMNGLLLYYLRRYQKVHAQLLPINVQPVGTNEAQATFEVLLTGGAGWLPEAGQLYEVVTLWRRQDEEWVLHVADWQASGRTRD